MIDRPHCRYNILMAEKLLDRSFVILILKQVRAKELRPEYLLLRSSIISSFPDQCNDENLNIE